MPKLWFKRNWKRGLVICVCILFLLDHQLWHKIQFDAVTISLIVIIAVFLSLPNPQIIFPYIKRIKLWEAEIELKEEIKELGKEVEKAQAAVAHIPILGPSQTPSTKQEQSNNQLRNVEDVLIAAGKDPRAGLLLLGINLETEVKRRLNGAGITSSNRYMPLSQAIQKGIDEGIFPPEILPAFRDFWNVRNRVAHAEAFDVDDRTILSLISIGTELLKVISTEKAV